MAKGGGKKSAKALRDAANKLLADNRFARHQYEILETLECGLELLGTEVKSIRAGQVNLRDGFCLIRTGELQLHNVHISPHSHAGANFNPDPLPARQLPQSSASAIMPHKRTSSCQAVATRSARARVWECC